MTSKAPTALIDASNGTCATLPETRGEPTCARAYSRASGKQIHPDEVGAGFVSLQILQHAAGAAAGVEETKPPSVSSRLLLYEVGDKPVAAAIPKVPILHPRQIGEERRVVITRHQRDCSFQ